MSAMAFVMSAYIWLWQAMQGTGECAREFIPSIWRGQFLGFVFVMIISICVGVYYFYVAARPLQIWGEVVVLMTSLIILCFYTNKPDRLSTVVRNIREMFYFGIVCLIGWAITIGFGLCLFYVFKFISFISHADADMLVIIIPGALWNLPILVMVHKVMQNAKTRRALKGQGFYKFLWPVLLAYAVLLIPLMVQQIANSDDWHEMKNAKIIRKV